MILHRVSRARWIGRLRPGVAHDSCPAAPATGELEIASSPPRSWLRTAHAGSSRDTGPALVPDGAGCMMLLEVRDHAAGGPDQVTVQPGVADRPSLASKIRGWKDDATGLEQRLKDLETIARSLRRRWWLVGRSEERRVGKECRSRW